MTCWVYVHSQKAAEDYGDLWTVGFYGPDGRWHPDSDHETKDQAAERVAWLNGGGRDCGCEHSDEPCEATSPDGKYACTRPLEHDGEHVACGMRHRQRVWHDDGLPA